MSREQINNPLRIVFTGINKKVLGQYLSFLQAEFDPIESRLIEHLESLFKQLCDFRPQIIVIVSHDSSSTLTDILAIVDKQVLPVSLIVISSGLSKSEENALFKSGVSYIIDPKDIVHLPFAIREIIRRSNPEYSNLATIHRLTQSESHLIAVINNTDDLIITVDLNLRLTAYNQAFEEWFKYERGYLPEIGQLIYTFLGEETTKQIKSNIERTLTGEKIIFQLAYQSKNRKYYFETHFNPILIDGKMVGVNSRLHDITESIYEKEGFERTRKELSLKNKVDECFLTLPDEKIHKSLLGIICDAFQTKLNFLAFYNTEEEEISIDSVLIRNNTEDADNNLSDFRSSSAYPSGIWRKFWQRIVFDRKTIVQECNIQTEDNQPTIERVLICPLLYKEELVGLLQIANKPEPFDNEDKQLLQSLTAHLAPIFVARRARQDEELRRIQAVRAQQESERRLTLLMNNLPGMAYRCTNDPEWTMEFVSAGCYQLTGFQQEDLIGNRLLSFNSLILENYQQYLWEKWQMVLCKKDVFQDIYRIKTKQGKEKWVWEQGQGVYDRRGDLIALEGFIVDITAQQEGQDMLRRSEQRYRQLFENMAQGVVYYNNNGEIVMANPAAEKIFGLSFNNSTGQYSFDPNWKMVHPDGTAIREDEHPAHQALQTGKPAEKVLIGFEHRNSGEQKWINVSAIPQPEDSDKPSGSVFATFEDVTALYTVAQELRLTRDEARKANQLKDSFIANLSHEIRTPLNALLGFSDLLLSGIRDMQESGIDEFLLEVNKAGSRLMRSMDLILNYSRTQVEDYPLIPSEIDLMDLIEQQSTDYIEIAKKRGIGFSIEALCEKTVITADEYSLGIAFGNLIDNALKYTHEGHISIRLFCEQSHLCVEIADTGIGMAPEFIEKIFTPYFQEDIGPNRAYEGLGLGLSLSRKLLEYNNATINVKSTKEKGSIFTITFNESVLKKDMQSKTNNSSYSPTESLPVILVVEDDASSQFYMEVILNRAFRPIIVSNDREVFDVLEKEKVAMILMDISLRESMSGLDITRKIRSEPRFKEIPVVAVTAHAFPTDKQRSLEAGCNEYLSKPVKRGELLAVINKYLENG